jgi:hypothetical protein
MARSAGRPRVSAQVLAVSQLDHVKGEQEDVSATLPASQRRSERVEVDAAPVAHHGLALGGGAQATVRIEARLVGLFPRQRLIHSLKPKSVDNPVNIHPLWPFGDRVVDQNQYYCTVFVRAAGFVADQFFSPGCLPSFPP